MSASVNQSVEMTDAVLVADLRQVRLAEERSRLWLQTYAVLKRLIDVLGGFMGTLLLVPIVVIVKLAMLMTGDFGSMFYLQERVGKDGKIFKLVKFRSMCLDAEERLQKLLAEDKAAAREYAKMHKLKNDPRITKVGKFLRRSSLDELPQCINILLGQMSLVGPRPFLPRELEKHYVRPEIYRGIKPGLTSYWAVNGRSDVSYRKRLELEYYYVDNFSPLLDLKILAKTFGAVVKGSGAK